MVDRARCPTAEPSCIAASMGPMVAIQRARKSAGPGSSPGSGPSPKAGSRSPEPPVAPRFVVPPAKPNPPGMPGPPAPGPAGPGASGSTRSGTSGVPRPGRSRGPAELPASSGGGSTMASSRNRQSSTVCQAHVPGATAAISRAAPVEVMGRPVNSATWSSAMCASSSNLIRSAGATFPSGSPPLATPWARVRARSTRAPPGDDPPMSWSRSPRICSRKLPPAPGPGKATLCIVGGHRRRRSAGCGDRSQVPQPCGESANVTGTTALSGPRSTASCTVVPGATV